MENAQEKSGIKAIKEKIIWLTSALILVVLLGGISETGSISSPLERIWAFVGYFIGVSVLGLIIGAFISRKEKGEAGAKKMFNTATIINVLLITGAIWNATFGYSAKNKPAVNQVNVKENQTETIKSSTDDHIIDRVIDSINRLDANAKLSDLRYSLYKTEPEKSNEIICDLQLASDFKTGLDGHLPEQYRNSTISELFKGELPIEKSNQKIREKIRSGLDSSICE